MAVIAHVGDIGTLIRVTVQTLDIPVDLRAATTTRFVIRRPNGLLIEKPSSFTINGSDGRVQYAVEQGIFVEPGRYDICIYVELAGYKGHTTRASFDVEAV